MIYQRRKNDMLNRDEVDSAIKLPLFQLPESDFSMFPAQPGYFNLFEPRYILLYERALSCDNSFVIHCSGAKGKLGVIVDVLDTNRPIVGPYHINIKVKCRTRVRFIKDAEVADAPEDKQVLFCVDSFNYHILQ